MHIPLGILALDLSTVSGRLGQVEATRDPVRECEMNRAEAFTSYYQRQPEIRNDRRARGPFAVIYGC
jgi:hypothetical protein